MKDGKDQKTPNRERKLDDWLVWVGVASALAFILFVEGEWTLEFKHWLTGVASAITITFFYFRLKNQEAQLETQIRKEIDDRFNSAITLLGNSETSARTGAIYSLYHLAIDNKKYRKQIAEILCSHIRSKTQENEYQKQKNHAGRPSNEIQTAINLLFRDIDSTQGLYVKFPAPQLPQANLSHAYLVGANFKGAHCQGVNFSGAICNNTIFSQANCQQTNFSIAECRKAFFNESRCQRAMFDRTQCQKGNFSGANCQNAYFSDANCQGASFVHTNCQGTIFINANCQGANFLSAHCQGAFFANANLQCASFINTNCQGGCFSYARCQGVNFSGTFEGAYALDDVYYIPLSERIGKNTEINTMLFVGEFHQGDIDAIEKEKDMFIRPWREHAKMVIDKNKGLPDDYQCRITRVGILKDTPGIRKISKEIEDGNSFLNSPPFPEPAPLTHTS